VATVISVDGLRKTYGSTVAVRDVSFTVDAGEIFGLLGPNGAGKTTTVESVQGLRRADEGTITVLGLDPATQTAELRRRIGSQLQESALPDRIKVWEALELFTTLAPGAAHWPTLMEQWGLSGKRDATFGSLSGGQQQRLFVALALVNEPEAVFLDEMTTGLDPAARRVAWSLIREIRERGTTVVLVTHLMDEAEALCDRVAIVDGGRIVDLDTPQGLIARHAGQVEVRFSAHLDDLSWLEAIDGVERAGRRGNQVEIAGRGRCWRWSRRVWSNGGSLPRTFAWSAPRSRMCSSR
jgi:ABC-2 type transport system ATP-binding protein